MSRRNRPEEKARRRKERLERPLPDPAMKRYGECIYCTAYTIVYEPAGICAKCLEKEL